MKILLTGGTGFVGSHAVEALRASGHELRCVVRSPEKAQRVLGEQDVEPVVGDLGSVDRWASALEDVELVVHVAGRTAARSRALLQRDNVEGTASLLDAARASGGRIAFLFVSSLAAAGPAARGKPRTESDPPRPVSAYGRSKLAAEELVRGSGMPWAIVRPPAVYGPRDREFLSVFLAARRGGVPLVGDGLQELSLIHVRDLARAIERAATLLVEGEHGHTWHPAHREVLTTREVARAAAQAVERPGAWAPRIPRPLAWPILAGTGLVAGLFGRDTLMNADKWHELGAPAWTVDPSATERGLDWTAEIAVADGFPSTVAWYRAEGWLRR